jgi:hypothetical protein
MAIRGAHYGQVAGKIGINLGVFCKGKMIQSVVVNQEI